MGPSHTLIRLKGRFDREKRAHGAPSTATNSGFTTYPRRKRETPPCTPIGLKECFDREKERD